ncbi:MAG: AI-2E family transporter [Planctomycetes bacterium]|nr:AI-2E family transporter [Planctomycetota bacterium]
MAHVLNFSGAGAVRRAATFTLLLGLVALLYFGRRLSIPFVLATLITLLLAPAVDRLQHWGLRRFIAVGIVVGLALTLLIGAMGILTGQLARLAGHFQQYQETVRIKVRAIAEPVLSTLGKGQAATDRIHEGIASAIRRETEGGAPATLTAGEKAGIAERLQADAVCILALPPSAYRRVGYLHKMRRRWRPDVPILFWNWSLKEEAERIDGRGARDDLTFSVRTIAESRRKIAELSESLKLSARVHKSV